MTTNQRQIVTPETIAGRRSLLTPRVAAQYCGLSVSAMNKRRLTGDGPAFLKLGAKVLYDPADLDSWLASNRRASTSWAGQ